MIGRIKTEILKFLLIKSNMKSLTGTVKTVAPLPSVTLSAVAPAVPEVKVQDLVSILTSLKKENGSQLVDHNQALALTSLKFERGDTILTLEDRPFVYEVVNMLSALDYDVVYNFLNAGWEKAFGQSANLRNKIIFENPLLSKAKDKMAIDMEIYRNKVEVGIGAVNCKKCGSLETMSVEKQTRSADEPMTIRVTCIQCGYKWTAQ